jgi:Domain of unknown function (DUF6458)
MGIGASVFLMAVGAILAFAVHATVSGIDVQVIGFILIAAGVIGLALTLIVFAPRRNASRGSVVEERRVYDDRNI